MNYNILRENDIRGSYPNEINEETVSIIARAFAFYIHQNNSAKCIIGHDNRLSSDSLFKTFKTELYNSGIDIIDIGLVTTPMLNYAMYLYDDYYGIMITASHNKASDNGIKLFGKDKLHLKNYELKTLYNYIKNKESIKATGTIKQINIKDKYVSMLINKFGTINESVVVDTGNGTASTIIKEVFSKIFLDVTYINSESDGSFPVHNPDPNVEENLELLSSMVKIKNASIGIAVDGDCDRVGIVDNNGFVIPTDMLIGIFARRIIPKTNQKNVIIDVKCSKSLELDLLKIGANPIMEKNGSAHIETVVNEKNALIGGEYSGHIFFKDDYFGFDDGLYAGLRTAKLINEEKIKSSSLLDNFEKFISTEEIRIETTDEAKLNCLAYIKEYALKKYSDCLLIDGVRINFLDGFALVRCSNTGPFITARFEAKTNETLIERKNEFVTLIDNYLKQKI